MTPFCMETTNTVSIDEGSNQRRNKMGHADIVYKEKKEWDAMIAKGDRESRQSDKLLSLVMANLRPAHKSDYQGFLDVRSAPCTHFYGYNMPSDFYVAVTDCIIPPLHGAKSISVIAPNGINVHHQDGEHTHNEIYDMDEPEESGFCPSYNDANQG